MSQKKQREISPKNAPRRRSKATKELVWTLDWLGESKVIHITVSKHKLTNGFRKLALAKPVDRSFRKTLTAIRARIRTKLRMPVKDADQFVAEMRAQTSLAVVERYLLALLKEDLADLLSVCSSVATDTIAGAQGLPRDTPADFLQAIHERRKKRVAVFFKTGRKLGQTGRRRLSRREIENKEKRAQRTLTAIARVNVSRANLTATAVAKEIGISAKQFREVWLPDLFELTGCKKWEQFITRKNLTKLWAEVRGTQKVS